MMIRGCYWVLAGWGGGCFPIVPPFPFSFLFIDKEGEGISNEEVWIKERQANPARDGSASCNLLVHSTFLRILPVSDQGLNDTETTPPLLTSFHCLQNINILRNAPSGVQNYTYRIAQSASHVSNIS